MERRIYVAGKKLRPGSHLAKGSVPTAILLWAVSNIASQSSINCRMNDCSTLSSPSTPLGLNQIHVWHVALARSGFAELKLRALLAPEEQEAADRFRFAPDRRSFIIRRAVLRSLLARYLDRPAHGVSFHYGSHGKPNLVPAINPQEIRFNCSHSRDYALIALTRRREIGVDVAWHDPAVSPQELIPTVFSPQEQRALAQLPPALQQHAFFTAWTRKEAYIKALGLGLSFPLNRFSVSLSPEAPAALLEVTENPHELIRWSMETLAVGPEYSAALVYDGPAAQIRHLEWKADLA